MAEAVGGGRLGRIRVLSGGLLVIFAVVTSGRALAVRAGPPGLPARTVTLRVAAAEVLTINPSWKKDIKKLVSISSETFEDKFGIEFRIAAWEGWRPDKHLRSLPAILEDLKQKVRPEEADIVIGLVPPHLGGDTSSGIAEYISGYVLLELANPWTMAPVILHELGHVFGAVDLQEDGSVMNPGNPGLDFDPFSARVITLNRERSYRTASFPFPPAHLKEVISAFRGRAALKRHEPELHLFLAYLYVEAGDYPSASSESLEVLKLSPGSMDVRILLANLKLAQGNVDEAITEYQEILALDPDLPVVHFNLGVAWQRKGRAEEASSSFREAVRLKPTYAEAYANLAHLMLKKGEVESAMNYCRAAIKINPELFEGLCVLSIALILREDAKAIEEAGDLSRKAVALRPLHPEAHIILGIAYENMGKMGEAEAEFLKSLELKPDSIDAHLSLAVLLKKTGRDDQAGFHIAQINRIDPNFAAYYQSQPSPEALRLESLALPEKLR